MAPRGRGRRGRGRFSRFVKKVGSAGKKAVGTYKNLPPEVRGYVEGKAKSKLGMGRRGRGRRGRGPWGKIRKGLKFASKFL